MRPDPLDKVKPDNPVYLIGSAVGLLVTLAGGALTVSAWRGWRIFYNNRNDSEPGRYLTGTATGAIAAGILLAGLALLVWARRHKGR